MSVVVVSGCCIGTGVRSRSRRQLWLWLSVGSDWLQLCLSVVAVTGSYRGNVIRNTKITIDTLINYLLFSYYSDYLKLPVMIAMIRYCSKGKQALTCHAKVGKVEEEG